MSRSPWAVGGFDQYREIVTVQVLVAHDKLPRDAIVELTLTPDVVRRIEKGFLALYGEDEEE